VTDPNDPLAGIIASLKEPVTIAPELTERVMAEIDRLPPPLAAGASVERWWRRRWTIRLSPVGGLALAAGLAAVIFASQLAGRRAGGAAPAADGAIVVRATQFVLVAPGAAAVSVVGDFNDWSLAATPLARADDDGVWWVTVPLTPGRYRYAFVVDGTIWRPDPEAPAADDEFGRPNSVVTIGGA